MIVLASAIIDVANNIPHLPKKIFKNINVRYAMFNARNMTAKMTGRFGVIQLFFL